MRSRGGTRHPHSADHKHPQPQRPSRLATNALLQSLRLATYASHAVSVSPHCPSNNTLCCPSSTASLPKVARDCTVIARYRTSSQRRCSHKSIPVLPSSLTQRAAPYMHPNTLHHNAARPCLQDSQHPSSPFLCALMHWLTDRKLLHVTILPPIAVLASSYVAGHSTRTPRQRRRVFAAPRPAGSAIASRFFVCFLARGGGGWSACKCPNSSSAAVFSHCRHR